MKFLDYKVLKASFSLTPDIQPNKNYKVSPKINCSIKKGAGKIFCTFNVELARGEDVPPFEFSVSAVGSFSVEETEDVKTIAVKAAETVFPFVRTTVASLTQLANIPAYILPIIDMESLIRINKPQGAIVPTTPTTLN